MRTTVGWLISYRLGHWANRYFIAQSILSDQKLTNQLLIQQLVGTLSCSLARYPALIQITLFYCSFRPVKTPSSSTHEINEESMTQDQPWSVWNWTLAVNLRTVMTLTLANIRSNHDSTLNPWLAQEPSKFTLLQIKLGSNFISCWSCIEKFVKNSPICQGRREPLLGKIRADGKESLLSSPTMLTVMSEPYLGADFLDTKV